MSRKGGKGNESSDDSGESRYLGSAVDVLELKKYKDRVPDSTHHNHHYTRDRRPFRCHRSASPRENHNYRHQPPPYRSGSPRFRSCSPSSGSPTFNHRSHSPRYSRASKSGNLHYYGSRSSPHDSNDRSSLYRSRSSPKYHSPSPQLYQRDTYQKKANCRKTRSRSPEEYSNSFKDDPSDEDSCDSGRSNSKMSNRLDDALDEINDVKRNEFHSNKLDQHPVAAAQDNSQQPLFPGMYRSPVFYHAYPEQHNGLWAPIHNGQVTPLFSPMVYGYQQSPSAIQSNHDKDSTLQYVVNSDISTQLLSVLQPSRVNAQHAASVPLTGVAVHGQPTSAAQQTRITTNSSQLQQQLPTHSTDKLNSQALLALLQKQNQQSASSGQTSRSSTAQSSPAHRPLLQSNMADAMLDTEWMVAQQCLPSSHDRKTPPTQEQCLAAAVQVALAKSETSSMCTVSSESLPAIGVFWDIENCPVPSNKSALTVVQKIRDRYFHGHREAEFMCVCDINKENAHVIQELNDAQVTVAHINATAKNAADDKLRQSLRRFADTHSSPATVVLISGDVNFANDLSDLRHRHNLNIVLIHRPEVADALLACAQTTVCYTDLLNDIPFKSPTKTINGNEMTEVLVSNLPSGKEYGQIRNRLRQLSDNCGGRVNIIGDKAIVKFPTADSAARAKKRMDGEDVFGSKISVLLTSKSRVLMHALNNGHRKIGESPERKGKRNIQEQGQRTDNVENHTDNDKSKTEKSSRSALMIQQQLYQEKQQHHQQQHLRSEEKKKNWDTNRKRFNQITDKRQGIQSPVEDGEKKMNIHVVTPFKRKESGKDDVDDGYRRSYQKGSYTPEFYQQYSMDCSYGTIRHKQSSPVPPIYGPVSPTWRHSPPMMSPTGLLIPQYPNGIEILVGNLDERLPKKELRKILLSVFRQYCKVLHVGFSSVSEAALQAIVRVPRIADAHLAVAHINRCKIGSKRVHVTLAPNPNSNLDYLRNQVVSLLSDVPGGSLPLFKCSEIYENRFKRPLHVSDLYQIPDTVVVQDTTTGRIVSLTYYACKADKLSQLPTGSRNSPIIISPIPSREPTPEPCEEYCSVHDKQTEGEYKVQDENPCVVVSLKTFSAQVHTLLQIHDGRLPLISLPVCYSAEFHPLEVSDDLGVCLEHLLTCIQGVRVAVSKDSFKTVCWSQNNCRPPTPTPGGILRSPSPILTPQLFQFSKEVIELLKNSTHCRMSFSKFIPAYHHHFGRQCRVAEYGFTKLIELFDAIPHIIQVMGVYSAKTLTLTHRSQVKRFTQDLLKVLKSQASKQVTVSDFPAAYHRCFSRNWQVTDYGVCELHDLLPELPENTVMISGHNDDTIISIPRRDQTEDEKMKTKRFSKDVIDLLKHQPRFRLQFPKFIPAYHHHFGRQCRVADYGFNKLIELFEAISETVKVLDQGDEKSVTLTEFEQLALIAKQIIQILKRNKPQSLVIDEFLSTYTKHYGHAICLEDFNVTSTHQLMAKLPCVVQMVGDDDKAAICLIDRTCLQEFAHQTLVLLMEEEDGKLALDEFADAFYAVWGHRVISMEYGYSKLVDLLKAISAVVKVRSEWTDKCYVELIALHQFARKARLLLRKHHGAISFGQFADAYYHEFGTNLQPSQLGCGNMTALLALIPQVLSITGRGQGKTVTLNPDMKARAIKRCVSKQSSSDSKGSKEDECDDVIIEGEVDEKSDSTGGSHNPSPSIDEKSDSTGGSHKPSASENGPKELLNFTSPNHFEEDLLCHGLVPSCVPSPVLKPEYAPSQERDLICFDSPPPLADLEVATEDKLTDVLNLLDSSNHENMTHGSSTFTCGGGPFYDVSVSVNACNNDSLQTSDKSGATNAVGALTPSSLDASDECSSLYSYSDVASNTSTPNSMDITRPRSRGSNKPVQRNKGKYKLAANFFLPIQKQ
ncbi:meiosis regulator and mRNA stability factor 1-like isoform X2 [Glandiceps talaboti]